jgi:hypothetical protein
MDAWRINGHDVEYLDDDHLYLCDGVLLPSVTGIIEKQLGNKYKYVKQEILTKAQVLGTQMHKAIQDYEETGEECDLSELRNYKFLKSRFGWECLGCELPVIIFDDDKPVACGRLDMVGRIGDQIGLFDFKRKAALDKQHLAYQLNLYRIGYRQSYGIEAEFLRGIHLRDDVRKFVTIPIREEKTLELLHEFLKGEES